MTNSEFTIYSKPEYYADLIAHLNQAGQGDSVALATMNFEPEEIGMSAVVMALTSAAKRGVNVRLAIDAYNFMVNGRTKIVGPLWFTKNMPKHLPPYYRKKMAVIDRIKAAGGKITITNMPVNAFSQPFGGRSHIKYAVLNDYVYVGGCNLTASDDVDLMVGFKHATTSAWLLGFADKVDVSGSVRQALDDKDASFDVDLRTDILIDAGKSKQSLIYEKALELIDQADNFIFITCQLFPNSRTARHLLQAHKRGVKVTIIYNHPIRHHFHYPLHQLVTWRERTRLPPSFFANQLPRSHNYLHAKLIATEKTAIIGSHNYVPAGVNFGTAEIALLRRDPAFALEAIKTIEEQVAKP